SVVLSFSPHCRRPTPPHCIILSLHDALPISGRLLPVSEFNFPSMVTHFAYIRIWYSSPSNSSHNNCRDKHIGRFFVKPSDIRSQDRKSTRLNSSHVKISYAVFCQKKKSLMQ